MKHLILVIVFIPLLISCDEVTTVKGLWQSSKSDNGSFYEMWFFDDEFVFYAMKTDSTYIERMDGTWEMHGDTISLYSEKEGVTDIIVPLLSMNTMTIQYDKKILIMSRIYCFNSFNSFFDSSDVFIYNFIDKLLDMFTPEFMFKFMEVSLLKDGYSFILLIYLLFRIIIMCFFLGCCIWSIEILKWLIRCVKRKIDGEIHQNNG